MSRPSFLTPPKSPRYPTIARKRGQEGTVWLEIWLNKFGEQTRRIITKSSGVNVLDSAALATVSQWAFMPHRQTNITIASRVKIPIEFVLN
jgi:protein TonB